MDFTSPERERGVGSYPSPALRASSFLSLRIALHIFAMKRRLLYFLNNRKRISLPHFEKNAFFYQFDRCTALPLPPPNKLIRVPLFALAQEDQARPSTSTAGIRQRLGASVFSVHCHTPGLERKVRERACKCAVRSHRDTRHRHRCNANTIFRSSGVRERLDTPRARRIRPIPRHTPRRAVAACGTSNDSDTPSLGVCGLAPAEMQTTHYSLKDIGERMG